MSGEIRQQDCERGNIDKSGEAIFPKLHATCQHPF